MHKLGVNILENSIHAKSLTQVILDSFTLLMCLKDNEGGIGIEKEKSEEMEKAVDVSFISENCPLCLEPLELDDKKFFPCSCGYQVCRFCWHRIRTNENGLCPACRRIYPENPANFQPLTPEEIQKVKQQKKMKDIQKKQKIAENRKQLANIRVIQKNLVFAVGLPLELSQDAERKEKILQMFRQFGPTLKETITDKTSYAGTQGPGSCIYITFQKCEDAVRAVKALANTKIDGRSIKVSLGTTKYCSHFLKNAQCPKAECLYLHELADEEASFTKEDIHLGKHYEYEQKLLEQTLNNASQNKVTSPHVENRTNHNRNVDTCSESSEEQNTYSLQHNSCGSESSDLSPSSNTQNVESLRSIASEYQNESEKNQNSYSVNPEMRVNLEGSPKPVFRSEESILINNHSTNHNYQNPSLNPNFSNQLLQQKESEPPLPPQPNFMNNQVFESALQCRGQSPSSKESLFLQRIIQSQSSQSSMLLMNDSGSKNSVHDGLIMNQDHHSNAKSNSRDDDPDLGFDPCQESLKALEALVISEAKEKAKLQYIEAAANRSPLTNHRSPTSYEPFDPYNNHRNPTCATLPPLKVRDPPPGFANNCTQNMHFKPSFETASLNKSIALQNHLGARTNFGVQRFTQPPIPSNNSFLPDYTSTLSREIPDIIPPVLQQQQQQQHAQQRIMNLSQLQYPVPEQRTSPLWNNTSQSQRWPMDNSFFNQSVIENRVSNDFNMRMPTRTNELPTLRQWQQQIPANVNLSPFQDHSTLSEQNAKLQAMYKSLEAVRNSPSFGHRLQYTKKL